MSFFYFHNTKTGSASDVIAIRVIPNHKHYSAMRWYKEQGFTGSPQALIIDGYEAIRDGRTVYVNVANISDGADPVLYTNIYLMSYNQDADADTLAIVNQMLKHWHFNTDLIYSGDCVNADGDIGIQCLVDSDCETGEYCDSAKARVTRDTRRLADLVEIKIALNKYRDEHNHYPILSSGSYVPYSTISTWPSWNNILAEELNITLPSDPINRLGDCGDDRFESSTCWDDQAKEFADSDLTDDQFNLPDNSRSYVYSTTNNGANYDICGVMEAGYITEIEEGACKGSELLTQYSDEITNSLPQFIGDIMPIGYSGEPYQGFVSAVDSDGDELSWTFDIISCPIWNNLRMENTAVEDQKIILADNAGQAGDCEISITINDSRGGVVNQDYIIIVENGDVPIIQPIEDRTVIIGNDLSLTILAEEADNQYPLTFIFTGTPIGFNDAGVLDANQHDYNVSGTIIDDTKTYNVSVIAYDKYNGASDPVDFTITVENSPPIITSTPITNATACVDYSYDINANDPDSHIIQYSDLTNSLPNNLTIDPITGQIAGQPQTPNTYPIQIEARDEYYNQTIDPYSAKDTQNYDLIVTDEFFTVTAPGDCAFYVAPDGVSATLYHYPLSCFGTAVSSTINTVAWTRTTSPAIPAGLNVTINPGSGEIQSSAIDNINDPGDYTITTTATNDCGASYSDDFNLSVLPNEWCGDTNIQSIFGEDCDTTDLGGNDCTTIDAGFTGGSPLLCNNSCFFDTTNCCVDGCSSRECGPDPNGCWPSCPPGCGSNAYCSSGNCSCNAGWSACDGEETDADGCECNTSGSNVCWSGSCCEPAICESAWCDNYDDGCGGVIDCGSCGSGYVCNSTGSCVQKATGGTITASGGYIIHKFTSSGTFTVNVAMNVEVFVVGGGGGGDGGGNYVYDHGGAGGTVRTVTNMPTTAKSYAVVVGAGGAGLGREGNGVAGGSSSFNGLVAIGGSGGWVRPGGHGGNNADYSGVVASYPSGGGGAGAGGNGGQGGVCGGGVGVHSSISGTDIGYGGGGKGINGPGIATEGGGSNSAGVNGRGGGGGTKLHNGQNGGSGIVIIRYPD